MNMLNESEKSKYLLVSFNKYFPKGKGVTSPCLPLGGRRNEAGLGSPHSKRKIGEVD